MAKTEVVNFSRKHPNLRKLGLDNAKKIVFLPNYSHFEQRYCFPKQRYLSLNGNPPSKVWYTDYRTRLPKGSVAVFDKKRHVVSPNYLGPDVGCGMLLARFKQRLEDSLGDLNHGAYSIACRMQIDDKDIDGLWGRNHFIDIYEAQEIDISVPEIKKGDNLALIHSGSGRKRIDIFKNGLCGAKYLKAHDMASNFARENRQKLLEMVQEATKTEASQIFNRTHNFVEVNDDRIIYRRGAVCLRLGYVGIIPSTMAGDAVLVTPKPGISDLECSICSGTGRKISEKDAKSEFDSMEIRKRVYIPHFIDDDFLWNENPENYNSLEEIIQILEPYVNVVGRLKPVAHIQ